jgi:hypothetical protein
MSSADPRRRGRLALALLLAALVIAEGRAASARKPALAVTVAQAGGTPAADRPVTIRGPSSVSRTPSCASPPPPARR